jgi:hypothetical protein
MVLASYDDAREQMEPRLGGHESLERVTSFTSGDGDKPLLGDLEEALSGYGFADSQELLLVPLDGGYSVTVRTKSTVDVLSSGNWVH